jgi:hypothetical protein
MNPSEQEIKAAARSFLQALYEQPAATLGKSRWGFKEVRCGAPVASFLQGLFPQGRIVHLTRNVIDCFISLKQWELAHSSWTREWTEVALQDWERINASFLSANAMIPPHITIRYEDLTDKRVETVDKLCSFLEINSQDLDQCVFQKRLHYEGAEGQSERPGISRRSLTEVERQLLLRPPIPAINAALGYAMDFD